MICNPRSPLVVRRLGLGLLGLASLGLSACYIEPGGVYRNAYRGDYIDAPPHYAGGYRGGYDRVVVNRSPFFRGYGYGQPYHCRGHRYHDHHGRRGHHDRHGHRGHRGRHRSDHGDAAIRLVDPSSRHRGRDIPEGWHSREWFERRGYHTDHDRFEDRAGHRFGRGESHREALRRRR